MHQSPQDKPARGITYHMWDLGMWYHITISYTTISYIKSLNSLQAKSASCLFAHLNKVYMHDASAAHLCPKLVFHCYQKNKNKKLWCLRIKNSNKFKVSAQWYIQVDPLTKYSVSEQLFTQTNHQTIFFLIKSSNCQHNCTSYCCRINIVTHPEMCTKENNGADALCIQVYFDSWQESQQTPSKQCQLMPHFLSL